MPTSEIELTGFSLSVEADAVQAISSGWLLSGLRVAAPLPFTPRRLYRHGFHSWSQAAWLDLEDEHHPPALRQLWPQQDDPALFENYPCASSGVIALESGPDRALLLGALVPDARLEWQRPNLIASCAAPPPAGAAGPIWFLAEGPALQVFDDYAKLLAGAVATRIDKPAPRVWCSWYSLYRAISELAMLEILPDLAGFPFDVFQVDDGWQQHIGDWLPNVRFPSGMDSLAQAIRRQGFTPGLWLAPFIAASSAPVFQQHPEWFIRDGNGAPAAAGENWGGVYYGIDVTHPGAQEWIQETIRRAVGWGYTYLKLDFLFAASLRGSRFQPMPGEQAYRLGMQLVRQAAGSQAYILACGAPVLASLGVADGLRVGPDVTPYWDNYERTHHLHDPTGPSCRNALSTTLARLWLKPLIHIDPDVVFFRTRYNLLQPAEKAALQRLAQVCGFFATSDPPAWLDPAEKDALHQFLSNRPDIERLAYHRFRIAGEEFDFSPYLKGD